MKYSTIKDAARTCRDVTMLHNAKHTDRSLENGWKVRASRFLTPAGDLMLYHIVDPKGYTHGGMTSMQRFSTWAVAFIGGGL